MYETTTQTKITVFTQIGCGPCGMLKDWLNKKNIEFEEKDIKLNLEAREEFIDLGLQFTPFSYIEHKGEKYEVAGAAPKKFERILSL